MPASFAINCDVPQADINAFTAALARYEKETKRDMRGAVRSATIDLVRSLRKRTRKAPKMVAREDVRFGESDPSTSRGRKARRAASSSGGWWCRGGRTAGGRTMCTGSRCLPRCASGAGRSP